MVGTRHTTHPDDLVPGESNSPRQILRSVARTHPEQIADKERADQGASGCGADEAASVEASPAPLETPGARVKARHNAERCAQAAAKDAQAATALRHPGAAQDRNAFAGEGFRAGSTPTAQPGSQALAPGSRKRSSSVLTFERSPRDSTRTLPNLCPTLSARLKALQTSVSFERAPQSTALGTANTSVL